MKLILEGMVDGRYFRQSMAEGRQVVGRSAQAEVHLIHRSVSREHAVVTLAGDGVEVEDLGSRNGTFLNGQQVQGRMLARPGDLIRFGAVELRLAPADAPVPAPSSPATDMLSGSQTLHAATRLRWDDISEGRSEAQTAQLFKVLVEATPLLVQHKPLNEVFDTVLELIDKVVHARRALLLLQDDAGALQIRAARPATAVEERLMMSHTIMDTVISDRSALLVTDAQADDRFKDRQSIVEFDVRSALVAPLVDGDRVIGILYTDTDDPVVRFDDNQLHTFTLLANLTAIKISETKLLEEQREKERLAQEMQTAARIQRGLLPERLPRIAPYELEARQIPSRATAGDLYDAIALRDGTMIFVVGDVSGKGLGAALLMSNVMACLRLLYEEVPDLGKLMTRLNEQMFRNTDTRSFVTLFLARLDPVDHRLEYVNAGHNWPMLLRSDGEMQLLPATGIPIGMAPGMAYASETVTIPEGAILCVFTDGITEAAVGDDMYEDERLAESIRVRLGASLPNVADGVLEDLRRFLGPVEANDDITLLLLQRGGGSEATMTEVKGRLV